MSNEIVRKKKHSDEVAPLADPAPRASEQPFAPAPPPPPSAFAANPVPPASPPHEPPSPATGGTPRQAASPSAASLNGLPDGNNLDRIRNILFGSQARAFEARFSRLETQLQQEVEQLRSQVHQRFAELETFIREEDDAFSRRLADEKAEREAAVQQTQAALHAAEDTMKGTLNDAEARNAERERALRAKILEQANAHSEQMRLQFEAASQMIEKTVATLRHEKTDRHALADLFDEASARLRGNFHIE